MNDGPWGFLLAGVTMGLSAGMMPGPLTTLVLVQSLTHGPREGVKVCLAPLVTDAPIVALTVFVLARLRHQPLILGLISLAGAAVLLRYAWGCLTVKPLAAGAAEARPGSLKKGVIANFLSPNPYLFWLTVGAPAVLEAMDAAGLAGPVLYLGGFYLCLVASKSLAAILTGSFRRFLTSRTYKAIMAALGLGMAYFAVTYCRDGLRFLGLS